MVQAGTANPTEFPAHCPYYVKSPNPLLYAFSKHGCPVVPIMSQYACAKKIHNQAKEKPMPALFIDRDGVMNLMLYYADWGEYESPRTPDEYQLLPRVLGALTALQADGWQLFLISNQPGHAKGKITMQAQQDVHARFVSLLGDIRFTEYYYSYTHPKGVVPEYTGESPFRKPNPGFLWQAKADYQLDLSQCWMVGDCDTDVECGQQAGCRTALITYPYTAYKRQGKIVPDLICADFPDFVSQLRQIK